MKKLGLSEIIGGKFTDENGHEVMVYAFLPVGLAFRYRTTYANSAYAVDGIKYDADLSFIDVWPDFSPEELDMIAQTRLTSEVAVRAEALHKAMTAWLNRSKAR